MTFDGICGHFSVYFEVFRIRIELVRRKPNLAQDGTDVSFSDFGCRQRAMARGLSTHLPKAWAAHGMPLLPGSWPSITLVPQQANAQRHTPLELRVFLNDDARSDGVSGLRKNTARECIGVTLSLSQSQVVAPRELGTAAW